MSTPRHSACTSPDLIWIGEPAFSSAGANPARRICLCNHSQRLALRWGVGVNKGQCPGNRAAAARPRPSNPVWPSSCRAHEHHGSRQLLPQVTDERPLGEASRPLFLWGLQAIASQNKCQPPWENLNLWLELSRNTAVLASILSALLGGWGLIPSWLQPSISLRNRVKN